MTKPVHSGTEDPGELDIFGTGDAEPSLGAAAGTPAAAVKVHRRFGVIIPGTVGYHAGAVQSAAEAHLGWVRLHAFWRWMEPQKGVFNFAVMDQYVTDAIDCGLKIYIGMGFFPPPWANGTEGQNCQVFSSACASNPPQDPADYVRFVTAVVNRYKDRVRHFAIWNEPDYKGFWNGPFAQYIAEVLVPGAKAVKAASPTAKVIGPETFNSMNKLGMALDAAGRHLDIISVHLFRKTVETNIAHIKDELLFIKDKCPAKPVWVTAFGARSSELGEAGQATRLVDMISQLRAIPEVKRIIFYTMVDQEGELKQGILGPPSSGYRKKPAFFAIRDCLAKIMRLPAGT